MANKCPTCHSDNSDTARFCAGCGTKLDASAPIHPLGPIDRASLTRTLESTADELVRGTLFAGRYEIIEELGAGGMGKVYRAHDTTLNEEVALKLIKPEIAAEKRVVERFQNELKTARKITHKNVCRMYDFHKEGEALYLTMEYVRGEDLKSVIHRMGVLAAGKAVSVARQVAEGLGEAHKLGIIHRDLKPANIMIDKDGQAKIMDFGIARSPASRGMTAEGAIIGTPEYMSPEQVEGKEVDQRADIYALGVILFEMVTGRLPFDGETPFSIANKQKSEPPPDPRKFNPQIPAVISHAILRSLEKVKEKRYQTTAEFLAGLAAFDGAPSTGERVSARPKAKSSREDTVRSTTKKLLKPAALFVILVAAGIIVWRAIIPNNGDSGPFASGQQTLAVLPFTDLSPAKDQTAACEGFADALINALANVTGLQVRGKQSSFLFRAQDDRREIGRKLKVGKLLTGSFQKLGSRIRITVQLTNTADDTLLWSEKQDGEEEDQFDIQDRIASTVVARLNIRLTEAERMALEKRYTNSRDAYDLYIKAKYIERPTLPEQIQRAIPLYLDAIARDPSYVLPYIALARDYAALFYGFGVLPRDEAYQKAKDAVTKALALDNNNGAARAVLADLNSSFENDLVSAGQNFHRAIQLSPRDPTVLEIHSFFMVRTGRLKESLDDCRLMVEIDPLVPQYYMYLGRGYYFLRRYDDSALAYEKALELDPGHLNTLSWSLWTYLAQGRKDKALATAKLLDARDPDSFLFVQAIIEASSGRKEEAEKLKNAAKEWHSTFPLAIYYAALGDRGQALSMLKGLFHGNPAILSFCFMNHFFDKYRSDPEFVDLLHKSGFDQ